MSAKRTFNLLVFLLTFLKKDEDLDAGKCKGCDKFSDHCRCQDLVCAFNKTNQHLSSMKLLDRLAGHTLTFLIQEQISMHIQDTCKSVFDTSHIKNLEKVQIISFEMNKKILNNVFS